MCIRANLRSQSSPSGSQSRCTSLAPEDILGPSRPKPCTACTWSASVAVIRLSVSGRRKRCSRALDWVFCFVPYYPHFWSEPLPPAPAPVSVSVSVSARPLGSSGLWPFAVWTLFGQFAVEGWMELVATINLHISVHGADWGSCCCFRRLDASGNSEAGCRAIPRIWSCRVRCLPAMQLLPSFERVESGSTKGGRQTQLIPSCKTCIVDGP